MALKRLKDLKRLISKMFTLITLLSGLVAVKPESQFFDLFKSSNWIWRLVGAQHCPILRN